MTISHYQTASSSNGISTILCRWPDVVDGGEALVHFLVSKYPGVVSEPAAPTGLAALGHYVGGAGASGVDAGDVRGSVFYGVAAGTEDGATESIELTGGNSAHDRMFSYTRSGGSAWAAAISGGSQNTGSASWDVTGAESISIQAGDMIVVAALINRDGYVNANSETLIASGCTFSAVTDRSATGTTQGDDCYLMVWEFTCTSGSFTGTPRFTCTLGGSAATPLPAGVIAMVRLREDSGGTGATATLEGVAASPAVGTAAATGGAVAAIAGVAASVAVGAIVALGGAIAAVSGVAAAPAVGVVSASVSGAADAEMVGVAASPGVGAIAATGGAVAAVAGVAASPAVGSVDASTGSVTSAALSGVAAAPAVGTVGASGGAAAALSGVAAAPAVGVVSVTVSAPVVPMLASHQVVRAVGQALIDAGTSAGNNVNARNRALTFSTFPGLKVYADTDDFTAGDDSIGWPREQLHALALRVDCVVREPDDLETAMADVVSEVLTVLEGTEAASLVSPLEGVRLASQRIDYRVTTDGEQATGTASIRFEVTFSTASNDPETFI